MQLTLKMSDFALSVSATAGKKMCLHPKGGW